MSKKMMLLAVSVVSLAAFVLPATASATPAHISVAEQFTVTKGAVSSNAVFETTGGEKFECHEGVSGIGSWHSTTTGTKTLEFRGCTSSGFTCTTHAAEGGTGTAGTISTTHLPFHLITISPGVAGTLITPNAATNSFAHYTCAGGLIKRKITGNGIIDTITSPACGVASTTATLKFEQGATTGLQKHTTHTGVNYHWELNGVKTALIAEARMHFASAKTIACT